MRLPSRSEAWNWISRGGKAVWVLVLTGVAAYALWKIMTPTLVTWFPTTFQQFDIYPTERVVEPGRVVTRKEKEVEYRIREVPVPAPGVRVVETKVVRQIIYRNRAADRVVDAASKENRNELERLPGGNEPVSADRWNTILDGMCKYPLYESDPQCAGR